jgi:hypothetical protein
MTFKNHPTDMMDNPDGRDYCYRFQANNEDAWKKLKWAGWKNRLIERRPKKMEHLRTQIDHVTLKTYDKMGYIKGMKQYAVSPDWEKVPYSRGKREMRHANGGGSKIRSKERTEKWGTFTVETTVEHTPGEIRDAFENGVNENAIHHSIQRAVGWAVDDKLDTFREKMAEKRRELLEECDHPERCVERTHEPNDRVWCELCEMDYARDEFEYEMKQRNKDSKVAV